jgi:hypothetical protein
LRVAVDLAVAAWLAARVRAVAPLATACFGDLALPARGAANRPWTSSAERAAPFLDADFAGRATAAARFGRRTGFRFAAGFLAEPVVPLRSTTARLLPR